MALYLTRIVIVFDAALFDIDGIYQRFFSILLSTVESFIPHKKEIIRPRDKTMDDWSDP